MVVIFCFIHAHLKLKTWPHVQWLLGAGLVARFGKNEGWSWDATLQWIVGMENEKWLREPGDLWPSIA